jgi:tetratricopeptide (TPR) repeat protein
MEEERLLGSCSQTLILMVLAAALSGCSLPRFIMLHDPLTPEEHVNLGVSYERAGDLAAAANEYEAATKKLPLAWLYLGNVLFQEKQYPGAEKAYRKAIEKTGSADAYNNLAWLYYTTDQRLDEAQVLAEKAVELSPASERYTDTLEKIKSKLGR